MNENPSTAICPKCNARYSQPATVCSHCNISLPDSTDANNEAINSKQNSAFSFSIAGVLLITAMSAVFCSLLMNAPGLAILFAILSVPAFVRTRLISQRRTELGKPMSTGRKVLWFLGSLTLTTVVASALGVASIGTFFAVCLGGYKGAASEVALIFVASITAIAVTTCVLIACISWIKQRWRRDISRD